MERGKVIGYPETLVGKPDKYGFDAVIEFPMNFGLANRGLGIELGILSSQAVEKFKTRLPDARITDCTKAVDWIRMVKSDLEISVMRKTAAIADAAILRAQKSSAPACEKLTRCSRGRGAGAPLELMACRRRDAAAPDVLDATHGPHHVER
ncbi:hypothetical protein ACF1BQ_029955 [Bradyrhizobium sp. RDT10]